jgi:quercetin dioxygenase-like cupin family protein
MTVNKITREKAFRHDTEALKGWYYQLPEVDGGRSVIYAEVTGDHGQRIIKDKPRIYYIFEGEGEFTVNNEKTIAHPGDVIVIPSNATYSYHATKPILKLLLIMDLIDLSKLPPQKK